jgi:hypothetical protein
MPAISRAHPEQYGGSAPLSAAAAILEEISAPDAMEELATPKCT